MITIGQDRPRLRLFSCDIQSVKPDASFNLAPQLRADDDDSVTLRRKELMDVLKGNHENMYILNLLARREQKSGETVSKLTLLMQTTAYPAASACQQSAASHAQHAVAQPSNERH